MPIRKFKIINSKFETKKFQVSSLQFQEKRGMIIEHPTFKWEEFEEGLSIGCSEPGAGRSRDGLGQDVPAT
jgi:hypothetical protein